MSLHESFYRYVLGATTIAQTVDESIPYRTFLDPNEIDIRGTGTMLGFSLEGPSPESSTPVTRLAAAQLITNAFTRLGTGDTVDIIFHRLQAQEPPERHYPRLRGSSIRNTVRAFARPITG